MNDVAWVCGASRGVGRGVAAALADAAATVFSDIDGRVPRPLTLADI